MVASLGEINMVMKKVRTRVHSTKQARKWGGFAEEDAHTCPPGQKSTQGMAGAIWLPHESRAPSEQLTCGCIEGLWSLMRSHLQPLASALKSGKGYILALENEWKWCY